MKHHFYATIEGSNYKTPAARGSDVDSAIISHTRGWKCGVRVYGGHNHNPEEDYFEVYRTKGSTTYDGENLEWLCTVHDDGSVDYPDPDPEPVLVPDTELPTAEAAKKLVRAINSWMTEAVKAGASLSKMPEAVHKDLLDGMDRIEKL